MLSALCMHPAVLLGLLTMAGFLSIFYRLLTDGRLQLPGFIVARFSLLFARLRLFGGVSMELLADSFFDGSLALECWALRWVSLQVRTGMGSLEVVLRELSGCTFC